MPSTAGTGTYWPAKFPAGCLRIPCVLFDGYGPITALRRFRDYFRDHLHLRTANAMTSAEGRVIRELTVPGCEDVIILLDPEQRPARVETWHPFPNIMRIDRAGDVLWRCALLPQETAWKCLPVRRMERRLADRSDTLVRGHPRSDVGSDYGVPIHQVGPHRSRCPVHRIRV